MSMRALAAGAAIDPLALGVRVYDDVLADPDALRAQVLAQPAIDVPTSHGIFHGIRLPDEAIAATVNGMVGQYAPGQRVQLTFARQSPLGQLEPNDVHSDLDMGIRTAILYLSPQPADGDGTLFWRHRASGLVRGPWDEACQRDSHDRGAWECWCHIEARYNRLLLFPADYFHSRAIVQNFGAGDDARLIVVAFLVNRWEDA